MALQATTIQIFPGTTAKLIALAPASPGPDMDVRILQSVGAGPVNLGGTQVNASLGYPYASNAQPFAYLLGIGDDLYAGAVASVALTVLRNRAP